MRIRRSLFLLAFLLAVASVRGDTIKLKDGTVLEGDVTAEDNATLSIHLGQGLGRRVRCQRQKSPKDLPAPPAVLRNVVPSK